MRLQVRRYGTCESIVVNVAGSQKQAYRKEVLGGKFAATGRIVVGTLLWRPVDLIAFGPRRGAVNKTGIPGVRSPERFCLDFLSNPIFLGKKIKVCVVAKVLSHILRHPSNRKSGGLKIANKMIFRQTAEHLCGCTVLIYFKIIVYSKLIYCLFKFWEL